MGVANEVDSLCLLLICAALGYTVVLVQFEVQKKVVTIISWNAKHLDLRIENDYIEKQTCSKHRLCVYR